MVTVFRGKYNFLSNFFITPVTFRGVTYRSSEHAYMSAKSNDQQWKDYCANPGVSASDVKNNSQFIKLIDNWKDNKVRIMKQCLLSKFSNENMKKQLLDTGNQNLQEGNTWHDTFWGIDLTVNPNIGENNLGRLLMEIREELRNKKEDDSVYVNRADESEGGIMSGVFS